MGKGLSGKRIVLAASRKTDEMTTLIEKQGGTAIVRSLQGTVFLAEHQVEPDLRKFANQGADWAIFTTGIGLETLLEIAGKLDIEEQFLQTVRQAKVASRGYKTFSALKKLGIVPIAEDDDGTTRGLVRALASHDFQGKRVMVQLHGETAPTLMKFLDERGAEILQVLPYQHTPAEPETAAKLYQEMKNQEVDAVCFTTAIQVRSLFNYAKQFGYAEQLLQYFKENVLAVAVGKITAEALREEGIERYLAPENERMGAMIIELAQHYDRM